MIKRTHSDEELAACARREWMYRKRVYKHLVIEGKMAGAKADREIAMMREIAGIFEEKTQPKLI